MSVFQTAVGMMNVDDGLSTPAGDVVVSVDERFVTTAHFQIVGTGIGKARVEVTSVWQRTIGVDHLPHVTQRCDMETAGAIRDFFDLRQFAEPDQWVTFCESAHFGDNYRERLRKRSHIGRG